VLENVCGVLAVVSSDGEPIRGLNTPAKPATFRWSVSTEWSQPDAVWRHSRRRHRRLRCEAPDDRSAMAQVSAGQRIVSARLRGGRARRSTRAMPEAGEFVMNDVARRRSAGVPDVDGKESDDRLEFIGTDAVLDRPTDMAA
jgi:hypothetical protein